MINKDTKLFGSFSQKAGSVGCKLFNTCFRYDNLNAIYKSFSVADISVAVTSAKCLDFSGFAVSMPFKTQIIPLLDEIDDIVKRTNSCNTVILKYTGYGLTKTSNGFVSCRLYKLCGYNTDYMAVHTYLSELITSGILKKNITILGNGSYSGTVQVCCKELGIDYNLITRKDWDTIPLIENTVVFNCTPVTNIIIKSNNYFIDCINTTETGIKLAKIQASIQYKLYTENTFGKAYSFPLKV